MKNKVFVLGAIALVVLVFVALKLTTKPQPAPAPSAEAVSQGSFARDHSPTFGNPMAAVTVVEWFDPECESCRAFHPIVQKVIKDYGDRIRFVMRYMLYHPGSEFAASALQEAQELGKFEPALDLLFEKQPEWGDHHQPRADLIPTYLVTLGIPKEKLDKEYLLKKHSEKVRMDEADGKSVGVQGTPSFYVNGQPVAELGEQPLRSAIDAALAGAK